jgi:hypothetical protein
MGTPNPSPSPNPNDGDDDGNDSTFNPNSGIDCLTGVRNIPVVPFSREDADGDAWLAKMMVYSMLLDPRVNLCP